MRSFGSACVLAGGKGFRLGGRDKLYMELGGERLAWRVVRSLQSRFDDIIVATGRPESFAGMGVRTVTDEPGFQGPLAGLLSALRATTSLWLYLIAVDMPRFSTAWVDLLEARIGERAEGAPEPLACVASSGAFFEPFQAFYHFALPDIASKAASSGDPHGSIQALLSGRPLLRIGDADVLAACAPDLFFSVNTPEDLAAANDTFQF
ncbi:MAG: molybdenum cofactor guanylyltransferase [Spirochaetales bacterium]|nr:MAG: molybdenum cofactor guanylyltransferase [Spirochaetales bacterium]